MVNASSIATLSWGVEMDYEDQSSETVEKPLSRVCSQCGFSRSANDRYCPNGGLLHKKSEKFSDFEVGKIAALQELRTQVFVTLFVVGGLFSAALT